MHVAIRRLFGVVMVGIATGAMAFNLVAVAELAELGILYRPEQTAHLSDIQSNVPTPRNADTLDRDFDGGSPDELMVQVGNRVSAVGPGPATNDAVVLYAAALDGKPMLCAQVADLFAAVLRAKGYKVRRVELLRSLLPENDTHSIVEVYEGGRWVVYDPTFNATYELDAKRLGAQEIKARFLNGGIERVEAVPRGEVVYPARFGSYYMRWQPLFDNVIVPVEAQSRSLARFPILRWHFGPTAYFEVAEGHTGGALRAIHLLNEVFVLWIPMFWTATYLVGLVLIAPSLREVRAWRRRSANA